MHNPRTIDPEIERRIIELRREHPDWGKKRENRGTTADRPNKTINIDLCLVHAREVHEPNFSAFFQQMDELCEKSPEKGEEDAGATKDSGLDIFSQEKLSYDEKMDAYVLRNNKDKGDEREDSKKTNIEEMGRKAEIKR
ncbi:helix-turn-helix domain-containing protein, partial [Methanophagales archaeon]